MRSACSRPRASPARAAREASHLFERACDWASASREALRAGKPLRALDLALQAGDEALADGAASSVWLDGPDVVLRMDRAPGPLDTVDRDRLALAHLGV